MRLAAFLISPRTPKRYIITLQKKIDERMNVVKQDDARKKAGRQALARMKQNFKDELQNSFRFVFVCL